MSEAEFQPQFKAATRLGAARRQNQSLATSVHHNAVRGVVIELNDGCKICVPRRLFPELDKASYRALRQVRVMGIGQAIEWPAMDQQFDVLQLLADVIGSCKPTPKLGRAKAKVARAN